MNESFSETKEFTMRKLILKMSVSVDGFVGGPKGESDWIFRTVSNDAEKWEVDTHWNASLHLMGSRTYQDMAAWWPTAKGKFAPAMNEIPKAVFSRRGVGPPDKKLTTMGLKSARAANPGQQGAKASAKVWDSWLHPRICTGKLATEIKRLKQGSGKPLLAHGGAEFARSLIGTGLIDEYRLLVHPVVLGQGLPIFSDLRRPLDLALIESISFKSGAVAQIYRPKKKFA
jgi:dihydrofolate reductase